MKEFRKIPENLRKMSNEEIDRFSKNLWREYVLSKEKELNRNQLLKLRQIAYRIWCEKYPYENDDDSNSQLEEIYIDLLSQIEFEKP